MAFTSSLVRPRHWLAVLTLGAAAMPASAMEIAAEYHVPFTPENAAIGCFPAKKKPTLTVPSGAVVAIDGGGGMRFKRPAPGAPVTAPTAADVDAWLKEEKVATTVATCPALAETIAVLKDAPRAPGIPSGHLLNGPLYIEGAEPGDTLEIRILDVMPRLPYGTVIASPGLGALKSEVPRPYSHLVPLDLAHNACIYDSNVIVPMAPFMGIMATCPADSEGEYRRSGPPGNFGGNLDCKYLTAGTTLYLPVFQRGGLFYTGDSHAAQGDGEITISAVETANTCTLQFIVRKDLHLKMPRAENATHYLTFGLDPDLNKAMHQAIMETIDFLKEKQGYDFFDAYALSSIAVDFHVTQVVDQTEGVHGMIPKRLFIHDTDTYWYHPH